MKYLITQAYNQGEWFNKDFAIIQITDKFKDEIKEIKSFIETAPDKYKDQVSMKLYWPTFIEFYDSGCIDYDEEDSDDVNTDLLAIKDWADLMQTSSIEIENIVSLDYLLGEVERIETACIVSNNGVQFKAWNKYGDGEEMYTDYISFETILNF